MWSDDCAYRRCESGNWLEIGVPEGLFDAAEVPGTLLLWKVPGTLLLRKVPGTSRLESAWHIAPSQVALCLESAWHIVPPSKVPGTSCLAEVGIVPVPSRPNPLANRSTEPPDVPVTNRSMCLS